MSMMATSPAQPQTQTQHQPIPSSSSSSTTSALSPSLPIPNTTADAPLPITRSTSVKFKDQVSPREQQQQHAQQSHAHPQQQQQQQTPEVHVNGSPLKKGPIQRTPKSSLQGQGQGQDEAAWGKNFWVTLVDPQTGVSFFACPSTGEVSWDPPVGNFVLPPSEEGEWWEISDKTRGGLPYYYHTKTGRTVWDKPEGFVIPLTVLQNTALGRRLSKSFDFTTYADISTSGTGSPPTNSAAATTSSPSTTTVSPSPSQQHQQHQQQQQQPDAFQSNQAQQPSAWSNSNNNKAGHGQHHRRRSSSSTRARSHSASKANGHANGNGGVGNGGVGNGNGNGNGNAGNGHGKQAHSTPASPQGLQQRSLSSSESTHSQSYSHAQAQYAQVRSYSSHGYGHGHGGHAGHGGHGLGLGLGVRTELAPIPGSPYATEKEGSTNGDGGRDREREGRGEDSVPGTPSSSRFGMGMGLGGLGKKSGERTRDPPSPSPSPSRLRLSPSGSANGSGPPSPSPSPSPQMRHPPSLMPATATSSSPSPSHGHGASTNSNSKASAGFKPKKVPPQSLNAAVELISGSPPGTPVYTHSPGAGSGAGSPFGPRTTQKSPRVFVNEGKDKEKEKEKEKEGDGDTVSTESGYASQGDREGTSGSERERERERRKGSGNGVGGGGGGTGMGMNGGMNGGAGTALNGNGSVNVSMSVRMRGKEISGPVFDNEATLNLSPVKSRAGGRPIPVQGKPPTLQKGQIATLSTGLYPILPQALAEDIQQFVESDFAKQYFSTHKTGFIFRRKVPMEQMMTWQKTSLAGPLLNANRSLHKNAVKSFKIIQRLMGDTRGPSFRGGGGGGGEQLAAVSSANASSGSFHSSNSASGHGGGGGAGGPGGLGGGAAGKALLEEERWLLGEGLTHGELRDEIYCQVMKQLTGNPNPESVFKGWQLLCVLLVTFPPSKNFEAYLHSFLHQRTSQTESRVDVMAKYCLKRLALIAKKGPRGKAPSLSEIETASDAAFNPSTFGESLDFIFRLQERIYPSQTFKVPIVLPFLADGILALGGTKSEGIFRVPGDGEQVGEMKLRIDKGYYTLEGVDDPNVLASLLKLWLRELLDPLVPDEMYNDCITHAHDPEACVAVVSRLPTINRRVVLFIVSFLQIFLDERISKITKMTSANLALVMAPNLLRCDSESMAVVFTNASYEQTFVHNLLLHLRCNEVDPDYKPQHGLGAVPQTPRPSSSKARNRRT
ncbi:RhoGAP-domain-containing protein [Stereum hirsutum FP-91666 SS1]|uniref:RhoGAP-domain-containing protein n=1 Tax=Stereum hirsutum (strain FP-91666) TaxID=721885 RepID=R7RX62_STEHR|nr:RhoGAP-domain-containing protein [Stereum hirsutum FP-91666 SS1]EIM79976.1 RhoGAP-domain-containing protein [Stereum hirsutum FP-91666 SS1]